MTRRVVILGSTGSIGVQALDVVARSGGELEVVGLSAGTSSQALIEQARSHGVARIALADRDESTTLVAVTVTFCGDVSAVEGGVYLPPVEMLPTAGLMDQVTLVFAVFNTVAT